MRNYMNRALELATFGGSRVSPNPFVGAVIVYGNRIIGEGFHRCYGGPHAEVNAIRSVSIADRHHLRDATMYVTLEPCSHYGKTPPCANLIVDTGIPRVVIASRDPFLKQHRSGIGVLEDAGIEVETGLMEAEAKFLNRRFFTAHTFKRPFILLKWAETADGFIATKEGKPLKISSPLTQVLMHRERSFYDAIMVGVNTVITDNPRLDCRLWPMRLPKERPAKVCFDSSRLPQKASFRNGNEILKSPDETLSDFLSRLYTEHGITSLMVEGGAQTLRHFLEEGLYDEVRVETNLNLFSGCGIPAPSYPGHDTFDTASHGYLKSGSSSPKQDSGNPNPIPLLHEIPPLNFGSNLIRRFVKNY